MTPPRQAVERFARDTARLTAVPDPARPMGIAVSGGPDSMAMLALAAAAFPGCVKAATVDHRLRPAAADEAALVAGWCESQGIAHTTLSPRRPPAGASIQAQARSVRYRLLADWAMQVGVPAIATGHHADDQAETFLMRAVRGSGPSGLAGIRASWDFDPVRWAGDSEGAAHPGPLQPVRIIRPLLGWRRSELRDIAASIPFVDDPSNDDPRHDRTRFRALLAGGALDAIGLAAAADHCRQADAALSEVVDWLWRTRTRPGPPDECHIDVADLPAELRRRIAREAIGRVRLAAGITEGSWSGATNIESLLAALDRGARVTQAGVLASAHDTVWRFAPAPPRRSP